MNTKTDVVVTEELQAFIELSRNFSNKYFAGPSHEYEYPYVQNMMKVIEHAREIGFMGINLPVEHGGVGLGIDSLSVMLERMSMVDAGFAALIFTNATALEIINEAAVRTGKDDVYRLINETLSLPIAFQSYYSPDEYDLPSVSSVNGITILNGKVPLLVLGDNASCAVVAAGNNSESFSYYLIDLKNQGISASSPVLTIGLQCAIAVDVDIKGVPGILIGGENEGRQYFDAVSKRLSLAAASISLGIMKGCFAEAVGYANDRIQGARRIMEWPAVRLKLAEMHIKIDTADLCVSELRRMSGSGGDNASPLSYAAAIHIGSLACEVTCEGVQILGGNGYMKDYGEEKRMRDARQALSIFGMINCRKLRCIEEIVAADYDLI